MFKTKIIKYGFSLPLFFLYGIPSAYAQDTNLPDAINSIFQWGVGIIVFLAMGGVILGGYQYLISSGNAEAATKAKGTIINSLIGLGIALISVVVLQVFSGQFTSFSSSWFVDEKRIVWSPSYELTTSIDELNSKCSCGFVRVKKKGEDGEDVEKYYCYQFDCGVGTPIGYKNHKEECTRNSTDPNVLCVQGLECKEYVYDDQGHSTTRCEYPGCNKFSSTDYYLGTCMASSTGNPGCCSFTLECFERPEEPASYWCL